MEFKNRRFFLKLMAAGIVSSLIYIWNKLTLVHLKINKASLGNIPFNLNKPVLFEDNYIIVNQGIKTTVFSAHCTHLGCKISKMEGGRLVCPCHGSEYDLQGKVLKGPAYKNLKTVKFIISDDKKSITLL